MVVLKGTLKSNNCGGNTLAFGAIPAEILILAFLNTSARICSVTSSGVISGCSFMYCVPIQMLGFYDVKFVGNSIHR